MVERAHRREPLRFVKDISMLLKELIKHRPPGVGRHSRHCRLRCGGLQGAWRHPPHNPVLPALEGERPSVKVPSNGTERAQEVDVEDEVGAAQVDANAFDGLWLTRNRHLHIVCDPT